MDIFALHKDLIEAIKNRPDDNLTVPVEMNKSNQVLADTFDGKNTIENPASMFSPSGARDDLKTQLEERIIESNHNAWDLEKGIGLRKSTENADAKRVVKNEYSVDYAD